MTDNASDNDAYHITWLIRRLFRAMGREAGDYLEDLGVTTADRAVLEFLYPEKRLSVPAIARRYQVSRQHVQATVNGLLDKGLVATAANPDHKRSPLILLNDRGRDLFESIQVRDRRAIDELFAGIPAAERKQARQTLEKLYDQLS